MCVDDASAAVQQAAADFTKQLAFSWENHATLSDFWTASQQLEGLWLIFSFFIGLLYIFFTYIKHNLINFYKKKFVICVFYRVKLNRQYSAIRSETTVGRVAWLWQ